MSIKCNSELYYWPLVFAYPSLGPSIGRKLDPCVGSFHQSLSVRLHPIVLLYGETWLTSVGINGLSSLHCCRSGAQLGKECHVGILITDIVALKYCSPLIFTQLAGDWQFATLFNTDLKHFSYVNLLPRPFSFL